MHNTARAFVRLKASAKAAMGIAVPWKVRRIRVEEDQAAVWRAVTGEAYDDDVILLRQSQARRE